MSNILEGLSCQFFCILVFLHLSSSTLSWRVESAKLPVSAVFSFGDSTVDTGNNNYILTAAKSNFPPYGRDLPDHQPTGRFCNGRLGADFISADLGVKDKVPPYLDRSLTEEELLTGVCFGSAGTGFDPLTAATAGVIPMGAQLEYFKEYLAKVDSLVGRKRRESLVKNAVFIVSAGGNDYIFNYFGLSPRRKEFSLREYGAFIRRIQREFLEKLESLGARRIVAIGLPPIGCLPYVITLNPQSKPDNLGCIPSMNAVAASYNGILQHELAARRNSSVAKVVYADIYQSTIGLIRRASEFGYEETTIGCCGTGLVEFGPFCNPGSVTCPDASRYFFWDAVHPTDKTYALVIRSLRPTFAGLLQ